MLLPSYLLYSGDALIRALLDQASALSADEEITAEGMGNYAQAHSILGELNSQSNHSPSQVLLALHPRQQPQVLNSLSLLLNRFH